MTIVCCALAAVACLAMVLLDALALSVAPLSVTGLCHFLNIVAASRCQLRCCSCCHVSYSALSLL